MPSEIHWRETVSPFLSTTTQEALGVLGSRTATQGLLDGSGLLRLWEEFEGKGKAPSPPLTSAYGLYFIFVSIGGRDVPFYVGKGSLPYRLLQHFGLGAWVDQLITRYLGGAYGRPWIDIERPNVSARLQTFRVGLLLGTCADDKSVKAIGQLENQFIAFLCPIANRSGNRANSLYELDKFDLEERAKQWHSPAVTVEDFPGLLTSAKELHDATVRDHGPGRPR